jgi:glycosyltransferase involved in cell wall biosynthesis
MVTSAPAHSIVADGGKPDIMFVALSLDVGGAERHLAIVTPELARRGWPVSIYCLNRHGVYSDAVREAGVDVIGPVVQAEGRKTPHRRRMVLSGLASLKYFSILVRHRPRIVHFFLPEAYLFGAPPALMAGIPIRVMSRRDINVHQQRWPGVRRVEGWLHRHTSAVLGNSKRVLDDLRDEGCPADRLGLIYNGADLSPFERPVDRGAVRSALGLGMTDIVAIMIANLISYKGHSDLLKALAQANAGLPSPLRLVLAGRDDGIQAALVEEARELGLAEHVRFTGLRFDIPDLLRAADIGVHASHKEGFSNAIIESMAASLPMVVTDVGGNAEAVLDGVNGLVVPPKSPQQLAEALARLVTDPALRSRYGQASRARVERHFTLAACVDRYEALYDGLLHGKRPADIAEVSIDQLG